MQKPDENKPLRLSIRWKLILPFVAIIIIVLLILLPITNQVIARRLEDEADRRLSDTAQSVSKLLEQSQTQALLAANFVANLPEVEAIDEDVEVAEEALVPRRSELGLQELSYYTADYIPGSPAFFLCRASGCAPRTGEPEYTPYSR